MNPEVIMQKYDQLYAKMATSTNIHHMKLFGKVGRESMELIAKQMPARAEELLEQLCVVNWNNYLTPKEAESIVDRMEPTRPWPRDQWRAVMEQHRYVLEEEPYYNSCAMYVTMCMIYSDSLETLKRYTNGVDMFDFVHALAIDKLKDKDRVFNIREYFDV